MNLDDLNYCIAKTSEWINFLQSMQNEKIFNSIYVWLGKEIGETTILLNLLEHIKSNKISAIVKEKNSENNGL